MKRKGTKGITQDTDDQADKVGGDSFRERNMFIAPNNNN
jgi:hypothetical protein